jgi:hypothetical protein
MCIKLQTGCAFRLGKKPFRLGPDGQQRFHARAQVRLAGTGSIQKCPVRFRIFPAQDFTEQIHFLFAPVRHFSFSA